MKSTGDRNSKLMEKATSSRNLTGRADSNRLYAKHDFNLWTRRLLDRLRFSSVLDVCCGTGKQLVLYAARPDVSLIAGVDVSKEARDTAKENLNKTKTKARVILNAGKMENISLDQEINRTRFDLVSCFYGLYYSQDFKKTLDDMAGYLRPNGTLLIVGPYGKNNASLFDLLQRHFSLPELVTRSSGTFMEEEVYSVLKQHFEVKRETFVNEIHYPNADSLLNYWRASTFYFSEHEEAVRRDIKGHFSANGEFIVEKHVMAYIARRS